MTPALSLVSTTHSAGNDKLRSIVQCLKQSLCRLQAVLEMPQMRQFWLKSDTYSTMFEQSRLSQDNVGRKRCVSRSTRVALLTGGGPGPDALSALRLL